MLNNHQFAQRKREKSCTYGVTARSLQLSRRDRIHLEDSQSHRHAGSEMHV